MQQLVALDRAAREKGKKFRKKRFMFREIADSRGKHFVGIAGPRGAGKTVILLQTAVETPDSFYISLDTFSGDLFDAVKGFNEELNVKTFLLDEIHFYRNYEEALKKIYDFLDVRVIFTSSVSLSLFKSTYDLSRRVLIKKLYPFSFREFLYFKDGADIRPLTLGEIMSRKWDKDHLSYPDRFEQFLKGGNMPFSLDEPDTLSILRNILDAVIEKDIPAVGRLTLDELDNLRQTVKFIGSSRVDGINYSSISSNLKITKYKAKQYVSLLEKAFVLMRVMPAGANVMREPKILMALPYRLLYNEYSDAIGALREDFFVESMFAGGIKINYLKSTRGAKTPDYVISDKEQIIIEIGGKGKGREQFKGIKGKKEMIFAHSMETAGIKRPLFLAGML